MSEREPGDIVKVLEYYGSTEAGRAANRNGWVSIRCPFHSDTRASAAVNANFAGFNCLGCGIKGNAISLIMEVEKIDFISAVEFYERIVGEKHPGVSRPVQRLSGYDSLGRRKRFESGSGFDPKGWLRR